MYRRGPSAAAALSFGLKPTDFEQTTIRVWPDNQRVFELFLALRTQWRVGMSGIIGLDYNVLPWVMRTKGIARREQAEMFADLQTMEAAVLELAAQT